ncbi:hypothetical protein CDAR_208081 [Caerostris darwini]|uniref:Uncharacterized protein n=1 Tax=Caerostris darwini TaxID=1538125 RepID=A0AAV4W4R7_9ARAC|nr:hypothetical protein CDAR_208081 [Caerostris darwini]
MLLESFLKLGHFEQPFAPPFFCFEIVILSPSRHSVASKRSLASETIKAMLDHHFPVKVYPVEIHPATLDIKNLSNLEIERAISKNAPGVDKIPGEIIKEIYAANKSLRLIM